MYFMVKSCIHTVINVLQPPELDRPKYAVFVPLSSANAESHKIPRNRQIPWLNSKFRIPRKAVVSSNS